MNDQTRELPIGIIGDPTFRMDGSCRNARADEVDEKGALLPDVAEHQRKLRAQLAGGE